MHGFGLWATVAPAPGTGLMAGRGVVVASARARPSAVLLTSSTTCRRPARWAAASRGRPRRVPPRCERLSHRRRTPRSAGCCPTPPGDPEVAAEFRRLTEPDLRATKVANLPGCAPLADARPRLVVAPERRTGARGRADGPAPGARATAGHPHRRRRRRLDAGSPPADSARGRHRPVRPAAAQRCRPDAPPPVRRAGCPQAPGRAACSTSCARADAPERPAWLPPARLAPVNDAPIGIFDSGVGGLTVARAVLDQLPHESVLYIGDTANGPYGPKPLAAVRAHALEVMDDLVDAGVKMLVIACNSASSAVLRDARERYTQRRGLPGGRGDPARRAPRRRRHPDRPGSASSARAPPSSPAPTTTRSRSRRGCTSPPRPARSSSSSSRPARTSGPEVLEVARRLLAPIRGGRRRHARARLHPLPAAHRRHLLRDGRRRDAGVQRRGDGQGRLPHARGARPRARPAARPAHAPLPGHRATPTRSPRWPAGSWAPRCSASNRPRPAVTGPMRLTVVGLRRVLPGARLRGVVLPGPGRRPRRAHLERRCSTSATAPSVRCSAARPGGPRRDRPLPPAPRPHGRPVRPVRLPEVPPGRASVRRAPLPVHGPFGTASRLADAYGLEPGSRWPASSRCTPGARAAPCRSDR